MDEDEQDGEGDAGEGEEDAVELVHHKAEGGDEDYSFICCFPFTLEATYFFMKTLNSMAMIRQMQMMGFQTNLKQVNITCAFAK